MLNKIKEIKKEMGDDLLILAHHYQNDQIVSVADYVGDSLKLAQWQKRIRLQNTLYSVVFTLWQKLLIF